MNASNLTTHVKYYISDGMQKPKSDLSFLLPVALTALVFTSSGCGNNRPASANPTEPASAVADVMPVKDAQGTPIGKIVSIASRKHVTAALSEADEILVWDYDSNLKRLPAQHFSVNQFEKITSIGVGVTQICLLSDQSIYCATLANLHADKPTLDFQPVPSLSGGNVIAMAVGGYHLCAVIAADGSVQCLGKNLQGQLGTGQTSPEEKTPVAVKDLTQVTSIYAGQYTTCATNPTSTYCWGANGSGELGLGAADSIVSTPTSLAALKQTVLQIAGGRNHTCGLLTDHTVQCWGSNKELQLGNASVDAKVKSLSPVSVFAQDKSGKKAFSNISQIAVGNSYSCGLKSGKVYCWGNSLASFPRHVNGLKNVTAIAGGDFHTCAIHSNKSVTCFDHVGADVSGVN